MVSLGLKDGQLMEAYRMYANAGQVEKMEALSGAGISPQRYLEYKEKVASFESNRDLPYPGLNPDDKTTG